MRIGMPEILTIGSIVLLASNQSTFGWVFLGLAILGAAFRWGVEIQVAQEKSKDVDEVVKLLSEAGSAFSSLLKGSTTQSSNKNDPNFH